MFTYKVILSVLASTLMLASIIPYLIDVFRNKTKPHIFSWFIWSLLTGIAFVVQLSEHGGSGAWVTGASSLGALIVFLLSFTRGEKHIVLFDKICLVGALLSLALWWFTDKPLLAILLVSLTDAIGYLPTFRKSYMKPHEETASAYFLNGIAYSMSIVVLDSYTLTTWLYPVYVIIINSAMTLMLVVRRRQLSYKR